VAGINGGLWSPPAALKCESPSDAEREKDSERAAGGKDVAMTDFF